MTERWDAEKAAGELEREWLSARSLAEQRAVIARHLSRARASASDAAADRPWTPAVVEKIGAAVYDHPMSDGDALAVLIQCSDYVPETGGLPMQIERTREICKEIGKSALDASPLPEALGLIERVTRLKFHREGGVAFLILGLDDLKTDAAAFVARVREGE